MGKALYFCCSAAFVLCQFLKSLFENHLNNRWESSIFGKQLLLETVVEFLHEWRLLVRNIVEHRFIQNLFLYILYCVFPSEHRFIFHILNFYLNCNAFRKRKKCQITYIQHLLWTQAKIMLTWHRNLRLRFVQPDNA